jgi:hypothetical protein
MPGLAARAPGGQCRDLHGIYHVLAAAAWIDAPLLCRIPPHFVILQGAGGDFFWAGKVFMGAGSLWTFAGFFLVGCETHYL